MATKAQGRLAELERAKIVARRVQGLALLFDRAEELAHRAGEAVVEPGAAQMRAGDSGFGMEFDRLMAEVGALTESDAFRADDRRRIARAVTGRAVEDERGLTAVKGDERLRQQRRPRRLPGGSRRRRVNESARGRQ